MLQLHNSLTNQREVFTPVDINNVKMYVCGPTVYSDIHVGNARPMIVFDLLYKYLKYIYGDYKVTYVRNITDIDDKIVNAVPENISYSDFIYEQTYNFYKVTSDLGIDQTATNVSVTTSITPIVLYIIKLIDSGHAYISGGHVFFSVESAKNYNHGILSNRVGSLDNTESRIGVNELKRDQRDFVLWKPVTKGPSWFGPHGLMGRPGWHIECSVLSKIYLGDKIDIHGGGIDLIFPHHENERIQSCCLNTVDEPVGYWVHNGTLNLEGKKMAKSDGNVVLLKDAIAKWGSDVVRLNMLRTHYRKPINWTDLSLIETEIILDRLRAAISGGYTILNKLPEEIEAALNADLNSPLLLTKMFQFEKAKRVDELATTLKFLKMLGE